MNEIVDSMLRVMLRVVTVGLLIIGIVPMIDGNYAKAAALFACAATMAAMEGWK